MPPIGDVIAANVRAERARRRWTQADLGERVGWPRSSVSDVESGRRRVTADDLVALCVAFGVPLLKLADGADPGDLRALGLIRSGPGIGE
jgi:transcriptional regulator with XRE-family HTH domain